MSLFLWSRCTPYNADAKMYQPFGSKYKNLRYLLKTSITYKVTAADMANLPGISYKVYGTVDLWRAILEYNGLSDPLNDIYAGLLLNLPDKSELLTVLSATQSTNNTRTVTI